MHGQTVITNDGARYVVPLEESYEKLALEFELGTMVWRHNRFIFPAANVKCVIESTPQEVLDEITRRQEPDKPETSAETIKAPTIPKKEISF